MDNQHKQISGYRDFNQADLDLINEIKEAEKTVGTLYARVNASGEFDGRNLALAKTYLEDGFSRFVRAVAKPADPYGPSPRRDS